MIVRLLMMACRKFSYLRPPNLKFHNIDIPQRGSLRPRHLHPPLHLHRRPPPTHSHALAPFRRLLHPPHISRRLRRLAARTVGGERKTSRRACEDWEFSVRFEEGGECEDGGEIGELVGVVEVFGDFGVSVFVLWVHYLWGEEGCLR